MRPRQICRGIARSQRTYAASADVRFNEAPADLPGNYERGDIHRFDVLVASMRPRQICRGITQTAAIQVSRFALQ